jgi:hypothetical protein
VFIREFKEIASASSSKKLLSAKSAKATFSALAAVIGSFKSLFGESKDGYAESRSRVGIILLNCLRPLSAVIHVDSADARAAAVLPKSASSSTHEIQIHYIKITVSQHITVMFSGHWH